MGLEDRHQSAADGPRRITVKARHDALERIGLHEARHTFACLMIAAGVNAKALSTIMGHATIAFTFDVSGHLMPGGEHEARERIDGYRDRLDGAPHLRQWAGSACQSAKDQRGSAQDPGPAA